MGTSVDTSASSPSEGLARALTTVGTGAAVRAGSRVLITACTFATTVLVVRATGAERFGALAFGLSIVGLIAGLFTGFATASNRSIASVVATGGSPHEVVRAVSAVVLATAAAGAMVLLTSFALTQHQLDGEAVALLTVAMSLLLLGRVAAAAGSSIARGVGRMGFCQRVGVIVDRKMVQDTREGIVQHDHPWIQAYFRGARAARFAGGEANGA
jgi:hypothetical protein